MKKLAEKENKKAVPVELMEGLSQEFTDSKEKKYKLFQVLTEKEVWQTNGRVKRTMITHDGVKKIADKADVAKAYKINILTQPDAYNNYQYTMEVTVCRIGKEEDCANALGEANRSNLGSKGRGNPANMAEKRAYDRAVFRLLGITGLLSEEELSDSETQENMESLSPEDQKIIAPIVNQLLLATSKEHLIIFNNNMKKDSYKLNPEQLDYLRKLYKKKVGEISKVSF